MKAPHGHGMATIHSMRPFDKYECPDATETLLGANQTYVMITLPVPQGTTIKT